MAGLAQRIDRALGPGWYREWQELETRRSAAGRQLDSYQRQLVSICANDAAERFLKDSFWLAKIARDYRRGMELLGQGRRVDTEELGKVHDLYTLALGVVELDVELCLMLFGGGIAIALLLLPVALLQHRAEKLRRYTLQLKAELERARNSLYEAEAQLVLNTLLSGIALALPEISVVAKGAIFLGQIVSDQLLGPESARRHAGGSTLIQGVAAFADATEKIEKIRATRGARILRSRGFSAGAAFLGFTTDLDEVLAGYRYKEKIADALKRAEHAYEAVMAELRRHRPRLRLLPVLVQRWKLATASKAATAAEVRKALETDMRRYGYPLGLLPYQWRTLPRAGVTHAGARPPAAARPFTG